MNTLPTVAALAFFSAAFLGALCLASQRDGLGVVARVLAILGGLALVPSLGEPGSRALVVFALVVAGLAPHPLPHLLASGAAALVSLQGPADAPFWTPVLGLAAGAAAAGTASTAWSSWGSQPAWAAVWGGGAVALAVLVQDGARVLHWEFALGTRGASLELPGAAVLLGLTLLTSLGGSLILAAHLLTAASDSKGVRLARLLGQRALVFAAGLGVLSSGFVIAQGMSLRPVALITSAPSVVALLAATGLLVLGLVLLLGRPWPTGAIPEERGRKIMSWALGLAVLALALAGFEGWLRDGTVLGKRVPEVLAVALLGLSAWPRTWGGLLRRTLFLFGLASLIV